MHIKDKILMDKEELEREGPITVVVFGDSVTHGALLFENNYETVYWNRLRKKILQIRDYVPINIINAGIGGTSATTSVGRVEKQVLAYNPDLIIICFGLNDVNYELEVWLGSLKCIFKKCLSCGADVIFMTPNMLNTYVAEDTLEEIKDYAYITAEYQNSGRMDIYMKAAVELAKGMGVETCDCYAEWKKLSQTQDTTKLLINRINHPTAEMHELFANCLFDVLFPSKEIRNTSRESMMYEKK